MLPRWMISKEVMKTIALAVAEMILWYGGGCVDDIGSSGDDGVTFEHVVMGSRVNAFVVHGTIPFLSVPEAIELAAAKMMMILKWKH